MSLYFAFFLSGAAALVYQVVWQRALLTIYGVNVESVALVVAAFLVGLGTGSLLGGLLSRRPGLSPLRTVDRVVSLLVERSEIRRSSQRPDAAPFSSSKGGRPERPLRTSHG